MYLDHWKLKQQPFQNVANSSFTYLSEQHQEGLARLIFAIQGRRLGAILVGTYGSGKSMILELLARNDTVAARTRFIQFDVPHGGASGLARQLQSALHIDLPYHDIGTALENIRALIADPQGGFRHTTLAIDEAQLIKDPETFELLHRLTNFRTSDALGRPEASAFTLILAGHVLFEKMIQKDAALRQRLSLVWHLEPLDLRQTADYVANRMRAAGGEIGVFEPDTLSEIASSSGGLPRSINNICDVALMLGYSMKAQRINRRLILQAIDELKSERPNRDPLSGQTHP